jgi:transcriptional regulator with XRE-family HTH domain
MSVAVAKKRRPSSGFGPRLRRFREAKGLTQGELAELVGLKYQEVSRYERGVVEPSWPMAVAFADALAISLDELRGEAATEESGEE